MHEAQMHSENCFITLTYNDEHLPKDLSVSKAEAKRFIRRLVDALGHPVRYFLCGEYGAGRDPRFGCSRPHYHSCLFGVGFSDGYLWKDSASGEKLYRSPTLEAAWPYGHSSYGSLTFESAAYVARYVLKKQLGAEAGPRREILDVTTGEIITREHEFVLRSLRPGIGFTWLQKFRTDVYPFGTCVVNGKEVKSPRYYDKWFKIWDEQGAADLAARRSKQADAKFSDNSPARLRTKELVLRARLKFLKREL